MAIYTSHRFSPELAESAGIEAAILITQARRLVGDFGYRNDSGKTVYNMPIKRFKREFQYMDDLSGAMKDATEYSGGAVQFLTDAGRHVLIVVDGDIDG